MKTYHIFSELRRLLSGLHSDVLGETRRLGGAFREHVPANREGSERAGQQVVIALRRHVRRVSETLVPTAGAAEICKLQNSKNMGFQTFTITPITHL